MTASRHNIRIAGKRFAGFAGAYSRRSLRSRHLITHLGHRRLIDGTAESSSKTPQAIPLADDARAVPSRPDIRGHDRACRAHA